MSSIPMFHDKGPIIWHGDPLVLIGRKLARQVVSSRPALAAMEKLVRAMEGHDALVAVLGRLHSWIISAYIYKGYRHGLSELVAGVGESKQHRVSKW
jgi:hypothetical protein